MRNVGPDLADHIDFAIGTPHEIGEFAKEKGFENLYIEGGKTIRSFLREDLIDELILPIFRFVKCFYAI